MKKVYSILFALLFSTALFASGTAAENAMDGEPFLTSFSVYPNPTQGNLNIDFESADPNASLQLKVFNLIGQEIHSEGLLPYEGSRNVKLDLSSFPKGIYMIEISQGDQTRIKRVSVM